MNFINHTILFYTITCRNHSIFAGKDFRLKNNPKSSRGECFKGSNCFVQTTSSPEWSQAIPSLRDCLLMA